MHMELVNLSSASCSTTQNPMSQNGVEIDSDASLDHSPKVEHTQLLCNQGILQWINKHSKLYYGGNKHLSTFIDNNGVRRYLDSWLAAENDVEAQQSNIEDVQGVTKIYFQNEKLEIKYIKFLAHWEKLWKSFEDEPSDEIAAQAPLLRIFVEFFFHHRMCQIFTFLSLYNMFFTSAIAITAGNPLGTGSTIAIVFQMVIQIIVYWALKRCYTGCIFYETKQSEEATRLLDEATYSERRKAELEKIHVRKLATKKYSVHWLSTMKQLCIRSYVECRNIFNRNQDAVQKHDYHKKRNYYNLINISLKFLTLHNEIQVSDIKFNRISYRIALQFVLIVIPIYVFYTKIYGDIAFCRFRYHNSKYCNFVYFYSIETLGGVTVFFQWYIFISSILVGFVGLAYGGEIAYQLTNAWLNRYQDLRRVSSSNGKINSEVDRMFKTEVSTSKKSKRGFSESFRSSECIQPDTVEGNILTEEDFSTKLSRDAFEQHLFFSAYMKEAGALWSPIIIGLIVYGLYNSSGVIWYLCTAPLTPVILAQNLVYVGVRMVALLVYPLVSLAHANRYLVTIADIFIMSAPSDYSILGGRENWTGFLNAVPAVWTIFGLWITWERIFGMLWTIIASGVAVGITIVSASL